MAYKSGRKVKHIRKIYKKKKTPSQRAFSVLLFLIIVSALVFIGYSAGKPIKEFILNRRNSDDNYSSGWTPPETTTQTTQNTTEPEKPPVSDEGFVSLMLPLEALSDETALATALSQAKNNGYTSVSVTLKADGGNIYYLSSNAYARDSSAIVGSLTASQIASLIKSHGMTPIAEISVLKDHTSTRIFKELSYLFADGNSMWIDNKLENGGKSWMSPFSESARQYISDITAEIATSGFEIIVASDIVFPPFRNSDLNYIGDLVKDSNRHTALTSMAHVIQSKAYDSGARTLIQVRADETLKGTAEVYYPNELSGIDFAVVLDYGSLNSDITLKSGDVLSIKDLSIYEKTKTVLLKLNELSSPANVVPIIVKDSLSDSDLNNVIQALNDSGIDMYFVK